MTWSRRAALAAMGGLAFSRPARAGAEARDVVGQTLRPWRPGCLDIHHIATGRGDCALVIGPDGSSLMIDAGASASISPPALPVFPGPERRPGQWIARYALRRLNDTDRSGIDAFLATHQDPDHIGDPEPDAPLAPGGDWRLTGVSDVDALVPIHRLIDRGFPDYGPPGRTKRPYQLNYEAYVRGRVAAGRVVERFQPGRLDQLHPSASSDFHIRNLAANGEVWTGEGEAVRRLFPPLDALPPQDVPEENAWSAAIRLTYGDFAYFAAGDLTSSTFDGALPWRDMETAAARASGPVSVAVSPHHGMFDATGAEAARALRPRVWVISAWHAVHPSLSTLDRLFNPRLYPGPRDVFATGLDPSTQAAAPWLMNRLASRRGHVIVRVAPGGARFGVTVTDNADEQDRVTATFGPFDAAP